MAEVVARYRGRRVHGEVLGELHPGVALGIEQAKQRRFLAVFRARRVAGSRADAAILFVDQRIVVERLVAGVAPELLAHAFVQALGERFGEAVGQGLEQDGVVVVMVGFEACDVLLDPDARRNRESAEPVLLAGVLRRDEVGEAEVGPIGGLVHLLAQEAEGRWLAVRFDDHVVAQRVRRPQTEYRPGGQPLFLDQLLQHRAGVAIQLAGLGADDLVGKDRGIPAGQLPGVEERRPVDEADQFGQRIVVEDMQARLLRQRRRVIAPLACELLAAGLLQRHQPLAVTTVAMTLADLRVVRVVGSDEWRAQVGADKRLRHAYGARRVLHPDRRLLVMRVDLERSVRARGGRTADQQRHLEALPLHLAGDMAHFFQ